MIEIKNLYWIAGLLEGEGCFEGRTGCLVISVGSTDQDVILRVKEILGFGTFKAPRKLKSGKVFYGWSSTNQQKTAGLMMTLYPLMGERRRDKIVRCLDKWKMKTLAHKLKTKCINGHPLKGDNLIITYEGKYRKRRCKTCAMLRTRKYRENLQNLTEYNI